VAVAATAVTYLFSALCLATIGARPRPGPAEDEEPVRLLDIARGVRACLAHPLVRPLFATEVMRAFFGAFYSALYLIYLLEVLKLSVLMLGLAVACGGIGALIGAALTPPLTRRAGVGPIIVLTGLFAGAVGFLTPLAFGPPLVAFGFIVAAQLLSDGGATVSEITATSLRQTVMPPALLGRAAGAFMAAQGLAGIVGAVIGGVLGRGAGVRETLFIAAAGVALAPLIGLASPLWRTRAVGG
jgi:predicted MFS family arabinose efflux permease